MSGPPHQPARRVIERAAELPGVRPVRFFALLLPMWCVEISATIREAQPYEVFDRFLERAVAEAQLTTIPALATFFGVETSLVERGVRFLSTIGHLRHDDSVITLTELGYQSVRDGCRYVVKTDRQKLYFDGFSASPTPRSYYTAVTYLPEYKLKLADGTQFQPINSQEPFHTQALDALLQRTDRQDFNVPEALTNAHALTWRQEWLPAYLIENDGTPRYLAFSKASDGRDPYLEAICNDTPTVLDALASEPPPRTGQIWRAWLDAAGFRDVTPLQLPNGVLRAVLPATAFGPHSRFAWYKLGSFEPRQHTFLQLWCSDDNARRTAVLDRAASMIRFGKVRSQRDLTDQLELLAKQLEISAPDEHELQTYTIASGDDRLAAALELLA